MKRTTFLTSLTTLAVLAGGLLVFQQQARLATLRMEVAKLEAAQTPTLANRSAVSATPAASDGLSDPDRLELLRLRAEVTRLRTRQQELAPLRAENQFLREQVRQVSPPPGYVRMREAQFAGQATPEATLQSFFWALGKQDTNALCQVLSERASGRLMNELQQQGQAELLTMAHVLPGFRLVQTEQRSPSEVALTVELLPGEEPHEMTVHLQDGRWRLTF